MSNKNSETADNGKEPTRIYKELATYMNLGWQLAITMVLMALLGWWLDGKFNTKPWLLVGFTIFGAIAGMVSFLRTVLKSEKKK